MNQTKEFIALLSNEKFGTIVIKPPETKNTNRGGVSLKLFHIIRSLPSIAY